MAGKKPQAEARTGARKIADREPVHLRAVIEPAFRVTFPDEHYANGHAFIAATARGALRIARAWAQTNHNYRDNEVIVDLAQPELLEAVSWEVPLYPDES